MAITHSFYKKDTGEYVDELTQEELEKLRFDMWQSLFDMIGIE